MNLQLTTSDFDSRTKYYFAALAESDPDKAIELFDAGMLSSKSNFELMAPDFVSALIKNGHGDKALVWFAKYPELQKSADWTFVAEVLAHTDPELGARRYDLLAGNFRTSVISACFGKLAAIDLAGTMKRAAALDGQSDRDAALVAVAFQGTADGKFLGALDGLEFLSASNPNRQRLVGTVIAKWFLEDSTASLERFSGLKYSDKQLVLGSAQFKSVIFGNIAAGKGLDLLQQLALTKDSQALVTTYCVEFSKRDMGRWSTI